LRRGAPPSPPRTVSPVACSPPSRPGPGRTNGRCPGRRPSPRPRRRRCSAGGSRRRAGPGRGPCGDLRGRACATMFGEPACLLVCFFKSTANAFVAQVTLGWVGGVDGRWGVRWGTMFLELLRGKNSSSRERSLVRAKSECAVGGLSASFLRLTHVLHGVCTAVSQCHPKMLKLRVGGGGGWAALLCRSRSGTIPVSTSGERNSFERTGHHTRTSG